MFVLLVALGRRYGLFACLGQLINNSLTVQYRQKQLPQGTTRGRSTFSCAVFVLCCFVDLLFVCLFVALSFSAPQQSISQIKTPFVCLSGFPRVRREALREIPSEKTKLEILEAIWSRQSHPAATAAARGRRRLRLEKVEELASSRVTVSTEAQTSGESGGAGRVSSETNGVCGVGGGGGFYHESNGIMSDSISSCGSSSSSGSSGMGIPGRVSVSSSLGSLVLKCRERPSWGVDDALMSQTSQSATGLGGTAGVSSGIGARGVTVEAAAVLAAAEQSFDSVESLDEAGAAAMASAAAANWSPSSGPSHKQNESGYFPVRALVFPEAPTEEGAPREEDQAEEEAEQGVPGFDGGRIGGMLRRR